MVANPEQPVLGIVPLTAFRTDQIAAPRCALAIIVFGNGKRCPATAGNQEHAQRRGAALREITAEFHFLPPLLSRFSYACSIAEPSFAAEAIWE